MTDDGDPQAAAPRGKPWWEASTSVLSDLIRIDTQLGGPGERAAAEWIATLLSDAGAETTVVEAAPHRASLIARVPGQDTTLDPLLIQMHLDVVPAEPAEWTVHPLSGEVRDGWVWGRGAVDMKNMVAAVLTVVRHRLRSGRPPRRPLVLALFADEENAGVLGAQWIVEHRPDLLAGATTAIGEGGGYSVELDQNARLYPLHTAEKGWAAVQVTARAAPAHASRLYDQNPIRVLSHALGRLTYQRFPIHLSPQVADLLTAVCRVRGVRFDDADPESAAALLGADSSSAAAALRNTAHPTLISAGYQSNVIPGSASAELDCRYLPGRWDEFWGELLRALGPGVEAAATARTPGLTPSASGASQAVFDAALAALRGQDPGAVVAPALLSGGTDATHLQRLGIECVGFNPVLLPGEIDFWSLFHGVDERIPVSGLHFSARVLDDFLDRY